MDAESSQELTRIVLPPPGPHAAATPTTALAFDTVQELLWAGNDFGRVTSFHGSELRRYTSYRGHGMQEEAVKQILPCERGILSVGARSVHLSERRGRTIWHLTHPAFQDLRCICQTSSGASEILAAGCQNEMFVINIEKGQVVEVKPSSDHFTLLRRGGQYICAATSTGFVEILDSNTFTVLKKWKAHQGWINDMDANSGFLVTCGWSSRQHYGSVLDPLARVFDLKTLNPISPVTFPVGAAYVRLHPRMLTTGMIASRVGQLQTVDIMNNLMINVRQVNLVDAHLVGLEIAPSGQAMAIADSSCLIQLWGSPSHTRFTNHSEQTEFADESSLQKPPELGWSDDKPLNSIGMPFYREVLFSAWPTHMLFEVGAPPPTIDPDILKNLTRADSVAYASNPRKTRRNQIVQTTRGHVKSDSIEGPKFLSEQAKDGEDPGRRMSDVLEALNAASLDGTSKVDVPAMYRNVEIQYSRFGVDDFDFGYFNKTKHSGLETHIHNSYANSLLQLIRYTPLIRNLALFHTARSCIRDNCLLCEIGFLIDMLEKAAGLNCQATNFLKALTNTAAVSQLGLDEDSNANRSLSQMIQAMNRYLFEVIAQEFRDNSKPGPGALDTTTATLGLLHIRCAQCGNESFRNDGVYVHDLLYPPRNQTRPQLRNVVPFFSQILKASVERTDQTRGWCDRCKRYQHLLSQKRVRTVPPVLTLNTAAQTADAKHCWSKPNWLPKEIGIIVDSGNFFCFEGQDLKHHLQRGAYKIDVYELVGIVADINTSDHQKSHLVSIVNCGVSSRDSAVENDWNLFNDFLVRPVGSEEATGFDNAWKLPSIVTYQLKKYHGYVDDEWKQNLDTSLLYQHGPMRSRLEHENIFPLSFPFESVKPGMPVGIDAEFVSLQQEEIEIRADGSRATLRPSRLALARVSVLRGEDPSERRSQDLLAPPPRNESSVGEDGSRFRPFIDDYIHVSDPIVDYLTAFSGIAPGDLSPSTSPYAATGRLVSLKVAYKKLWLLLNLGCVFVGHGLPKDFRTINMHVPKSQVVDTVELFFSKRTQRKLSLRYLCWYLLGERVQVEGTGKGHDSIEDAQMALRLWTKWQELEAKGRTQKMIEEIYRKGRETNFRVPSVASPLLGAVTGPSGRGTPVSELEEGSSMPSTPPRGFISRKTMTDIP